MNAVVVDASVAIKWVIPEADSPTADLLLGGGHTLLAPDLLWTEVANVLWKHKRRGSLTTADAEGLLLDTKSLAVLLQPTRPLLASALRIAMEFDRTVYDSLYLALADELGTQLVTADKRLANALANTPLKHVAVLLANLK
jgi:predicted nucleic acid-binding protein